VELHQGVVLATLESLADQGFRKIVVGARMWTAFAWRCCGRVQLGQGRQRPCIYPRPSLP
jgi:hypothetical protein